MQTANYCISGRADGASVYLSQAIRFYVIGSIYIYWVNNPMKNIHFSTMEVIGLMEVVCCAFELFAEKESR